jgi:hypothetical protein
VLLGNVPDKIDAFDIALRPIALSEIDQVCAFGAKDVHPKTQRFRLSLTVHGPRALYGSVSIVLAHFRF